jgi:hypothetical protein
VKPTYDELEEIVALATALTISTRGREREAMKTDYASMACALRLLHERYRDSDWTLSILDAIARYEQREGDFPRFL